MVYTFCGWRELSAFYIVSEAGFDRFHIGSRSGKKTSTEENKMKEIEA